METKKEHNKKWYYKRKKNGWDYPRKDNDILPEFLSYVRYDRVKRSRKSVIRLLKRYNGNVSASEYIREAIKQNIDSMKSKEVRIILNQLKREWEINKII
jgi:hypothetical protein